MAGDLRSAARQGAAAQVLIGGVGLAVPLLGGVQAAFSTAVFFLAAMVPWLSVVCHVSRGDRDFSQEWMASVTGLISAILILFPLSAMVGYSGGVPLSPMAPGPMSILAAASIPVMSWISLGYFRGFLDPAHHGPLMPCLDYLGGALIAGLFLLAMTILSSLGMGDISVRVGRVALWAELLLGVELALSLTLEWYRPGKSDRRWFYGSRILGVLSGSSSASRAFREAWTYQFGVDISGSGFLRRTIGDIPAVILFAAISVWGLSSVFSVPCGCRGIVMRFGDPVGLASPGLGFKAPWPFDEVVLVDVDRVRRIHVGSHRPAADDGDIYKKGAPILWTNEHGLQSEYYIPVAPPGDVSMVVADQRIPSVSFVGADVFAEYRIDDPISYIENSLQGTDLLKQRAERAVSRVFARYDIDSIIGEGRDAAAGSLLADLRSDGDVRASGIEVDYVGIVGVHPPQRIASFFEETVSARQEKETAIQWAIQASVLKMTETAGDGNTAEALIDAIDRGDGEGSDSILEKCGGAVAWELGRALEYSAMRESTEGVRADRFLSVWRLLNAAPRYYRYSLYLDVLDSALPYRRKYVVPAQRDELLFRLSGIAPAVSLPLMDPESVEFHGQE